MPGIIHLVKSCSSSKAPRKGHLAGSGSPCFSQRESVFLLSIKEQAKLLQRLAPPRPGRCSASAFRVFLHRLVPTALGEHFRLCLVACAPNAVHAPWGQENLMLIESKEIANALVT